MGKSEPLVHGLYKLQKFPGKGGWTYAEVPEITPSTSSPFGWVQVRGKIDDYEFDHYKLMPMGNGNLFLPVRAAVRKLIGKQAGDSVNVLIYLDETPLQLPEEIEACFENEPTALLHTFKNFSTGEQKAFIDWIYSAKRDETKVSRIAQMMERLKSGLRLHDQPS